MLIIGSLALFQVNMITGLEPCSIDSIWFFSGSIIMVTDLGLCIKFNMALLNGLMVTALGPCSRLLTAFLQGLVVTDVTELLA